MLPTYQFLKNNSPGKVPSTRGSHGESLPVPRVISDMLVAYTSWAKAEDTVIMKHKIHEKWLGD